MMGYLRLSNGKQLTSLCSNTKKGVCTSSRKADRHMWRSRPPVSSTGRQRS